MKGEKQLFDIRFWDKEYNLVLGFVFEYYPEPFEEFVRRLVDIKLGCEQIKVVLFEGIDKKHSVPISYFRDFYWNVTSVENRSLEIENKLDEKE